MKDKLIHRGALLIKILRGPFGTFDLWKIANVQPFYSDIHSFPIFHTICNTIYYVIALVTSMGVFRNQVEGGGKPELTSTKSGELKIPPLQKKIHKQIENKSHIVNFTLVFTITFLFPTPFSLFPSFLYTLSKLSNCVY